MRNKAKNSFPKIFKRKINAGIFLLILLLSILPLTPIPTFMKHLFILLFMYIVLAQSWNVIGGLLGLVDFGHVVFFGIGGYTFAIALTYYNIPWYFSIILGGISAVLISLMVSPILRLRGAYFAIGMFALAEAFRIAFTNWSWVGGGGGMYVPIPKFSDIYLSFYYMMFVLLIITNYIVFRFMKSKLGLAAIAFRENYVTAHVIGIDIVKIRLYGFILSAIFPGLAGSIYAWYLSFVNPQAFFGEYLTALMIIMVIVGGRGRFIGPIVGAIIILILNQFAIYYFPGFDLIIFAIIIIVVTIFAPEGIYGLLKAIWSR